MSTTHLKLAHAPIVEAVLDIDCDMPPGTDLAALQGAARDEFKSHYPKSRIQFLDEHILARTAAKPAHFSSRRALQALQFLHEDEKQLVQVRAQGFSFNRLAPYTSLDDYLPEIQRTWSIFIKLAAPVQVRFVRLRYINRLVIPLTDQRMELVDYFKVSPRLPEEDKLVMVGFLHQHAALEPATGHHANMVLTSQPKVEGKLPVIFDIVVTAVENGAVEDWIRILSRIQSLRDLKNRIFRNTLTEKCLNLFQPR